MPIIFPRDQSTNAGWHSTHLPLDKMAAFSQTTFSNAFSWMKCLVFWLKFHWSLFLRVQFTITQRGFDVFFDLCLNHQVSKHWIHRWFETIAHSLWRHYNALLCHWCAARKWLSDWTCYESRVSFLIMGRTGHELSFISSWGYLGSVWQLSLQLISDFIYKYLFEPLNRVHIWQVSWQQSCSDVCQIWMGYITG